MKDVPIPQVGDDDLLLKGTSSHITYSLSIQRLISFQSYSFVLRYVECYRPAVFLVH
jgi:hypothetical protein